MECKLYKIFFWVLIMTDMQSTSNNKLMKYLQIWECRRRLWGVVDKLSTTDVLKVFCSNNLKYCRNFFCSQKADSSNMFNQHGSGQYGTPSPLPPPLLTDGRVLEMAFNQDIFSPRPLALVCPYSPLRSGWKRKGGRKVG